MNNSGITSKLDAYRDVGVVGSVEEADPNKLILLLMDGALEAMTRAEGLLSRGEIPDKAAALSKAVSLIDGLRAFLDHEQGGELSAALEQLYDYLVRRLTAANASNDLALIQESNGLLRGIRDAWAQMAESLNAQAESVGV